MFTAMENNVGEWTHAINRNCSDAACMFCSTVAMYKPTAYVFYALYLVTLLFLNLCLYRPCARYIDTPSATGTTGEFVNIVTITDGTPPATTAPTATTAPPSPSSGSAAMFVSAALVIVAVAVLLF